MSAFAPYCPITWYLAGYSCLMQTLIIKTKNKKKKKKQVKVYARLTAR